MIVVRDYYRSIIVVIPIAIVRRCRVGGGGGGITEHPIGRGHKFRVGYWCTTTIGGVVPFWSFSLATTQSWHIKSTSNNNNNTNNENSTNTKNSTKKCRDFLTLSHSLSLSLSIPPIQKKQITDTRRCHSGVFGISTE